MRLKWKTTSSATSSRSAITPVLAGNFTPLRSLTSSVSGVVQAQLSASSPRMASVGCQPLMVNGYLPPRLLALERSTEKSCS
ncbi:hypothetical protein D3C81_2247060 [compost metagenome]